MNGASLIAVVLLLTCYWIDWSEEVVESEGGDGEEKVQGHLGPTSNFFDSRKFQKLKTSHLHTGKLIGEYMVLFLLFFITEIRQP